MEEETVSLLGFSTVLILQGSVGNPIEIREVSSMGTFLTEVRSIHPKKRCYSSVGEIERDREKNTLTKPQTEKRGVLMFSL